MSGAQVQCVWCKSLYTSFDGEKGFSCDSFLSRGQIVCGENSSHSNKSFTIKDKKMSKGKSGLVCDTCINNLIDNEMFVESVESHNRKVSLTQEQKRVEENFLREDDPLLAEIKPDLKREDTLVFGENNETLFEKDDSDDLRMNPDFIFHQSGVFFYQVPGPFKIHADSMEELHKAFENQKKVWENQGKIDSWKEKEKNRKKSLD